MTNKRTQSKRTHLNMRLTEKSAESLNLLEEAYPKLTMTDIVNHLINWAAASPPSFTIVIEPEEREETVSN